MNYSLSLNNLINAESPIIMGILNITPDSFSDGGKFLDQDAAISQASLLLTQGASIIDIGAESSGLGSSAISADEEIRRMQDIVKPIAETCILSIDTYKAKTAEFCLKQGATIINDISALRADKELISVVKEYQAHIVLMHSKEEDTKPHASASAKVYTDIISEITEFLKERIDFCLDSGISEDKIILDPGMGGFISRNPEDSWKLLRELDVLCQNLKPFPVLIGTSRKKFLGLEISERDPLSQLTALNATTKGAKIIRTHNAKMAKDFLDCWKQL